jgi:hypothetical protein
VLNCNILHVTVISLPEIICDPAVTPSAPKPAEKNSALSATFVQNLDASFIADSELDAGEQ